MNDIQSILDELNSVKPEKLNGKARKLFDTIMQILDERDDLKAELHAEQIKNKKLELEKIPLLEGKIKQYEQHLDLEWAEENLIEKWKYKKLWKIIEKMAEEMSKRPLMIFKDKEKELEVTILDDPKSIIDYYTKKVEK